MAEIVVTPQLIAAGAYELRTRCFGEKIEDVVEAVFLAMLSEVSCSHYEPSGGIQDSIQMSEGQLSNSERGRID